MHDVVVIGGGIVGLATARAVLRERPGADVVVLEKETVLARHQTSHNSGVIHAGVYYEPGSLKAELCRRGSRATKEFCAEHGIPVGDIGKLIVATDETELERMAALEERSRRNDLLPQRLSAGELSEWEPNVRGVAALFYPGSSITDYGAVARAMGTEIQAGGGVIELGVQVDGIAESAGQVTVTGGERSWTARRVIACAGLQADRVARLAGVDAGVRIVPFRGEYYRLAPTHDDVVTRLIYPVPDPALPFLGVHLTPMIDGSVTIGPNAVLGLAREGYRKYSLDVRDAVDVATFSGMWRLARKQWRTGLNEIRNSVSQRAYLRAVQRYCPSLRVEDLRPYEAGIRAQAMGRDGRLVHDFLFAQSQRTLHVVNAPSPAATSAIPIGELIVQRALGSAG